MTARLVNGNGVVSAEVGPGTHISALKNTSRARNPYRVSTANVRSADKVHVRESCEN
jgi:hypothetical protein